VDPGRRTSTPLTGFSVVAGSVATFQAKGGSEVAEDGIDVNINWDFSGAIAGIGSSISSAGSDLWTATKEASDEGMAAVIGVVIIVAAGLVIWRMV
jgi:hypothetical protein